MSKIALLYSGQPRHVKECYQNHLETFYNVNPDDEIDVFAHIWYDPAWVGTFFWDQYKDRGRWEADLKDFMQDNWKPKGIVFEEPKEFIPEGIEPDSRFPHPVNNIISMFYSLDQVNSIKKKYEEENGFKYDCVIVARFDIGHRSTWHMGYNVSLMPFNPTLDMNYIYSAMWKQLNAGYADQWFFSNSENIDKFGTMYENALNDYFQKNSDYYNAIINGWFDSNESNETSNEIINKDGLAIYYKYPRWQMINNHILHKWHLREAGLYEKSKFLGEMR